MLDGRLLLDRLDGSGRHFLLNHGSRLTFDHFNAIDDQLFLDEFFFVVLLDSLGCFFVSFETIE